MSTLDVAPTRRWNSANTPRCWRGHLPVLLLALFTSGVAEADLSQTGRWQGPRKEH